MMLTRTVFGVSACLSVSPVRGKSNSVYGTLGLIHMSATDMFRDGKISLKASSFGANVRNAQTFQVLPRGYGADNDSRELRAERRKTTVQLRPRPKVVLPPAPFVLELSQ